MPDFSASSSCDQPNTIRAPLRRRGFAIIALVWSMAFAARETSDACFRKRGRDGPAAGAELHSWSRTAWVHASTGNSCVRPDFSTQGAVLATMLKQDAAGRRQGSTYLEIVRAHV